MIKRVVNVYIKKNIVVRTQLNELNTGIPYQENWIYELKQINPCKYKQINQTNHHSSINELYKIVANTSCFQALTSWTVSVNISRQSLSLDGFNESIYFLIH